MSNAPRSIICIVLAGLTLGLTPSNPKRPGGPLPGMEFVYIAPGTFLMGSSPHEPEHQHHERRHEVTLSRGFYLQTREVTVGQWRAFVRKTGYRSAAEKEGWATVYADGIWINREGNYWDQPGFSQTDDHPVTCVSWKDVQAFAQWVSHQGTGLYRLPTEAEWEYACRAGTTSSFAFGACLSTDQANYNGDIPLTGCGKGRFRKRTIPVGSLAANAWGLYDMHGNVLEWCQDNADWDDASKSVVTDTYRDRVRDPLCVTGAQRVGRGGGWSGHARYCRSANRGSITPDYRGSDLGFRLVLIPSADQIVGAAQIE